jgi:phage tail protein X
MDGDFLPWAFADFSGYVAADALYDGPFCLLSAVDKRCYKRILYDVLDHDPTHEDSRGFRRRLHPAWSTRNLPLVGVTTDGSARSPVPLAEVFGDVPHPIWTFHLVAEVNKAVIGAVASARQGLAAQQPTLRQGRPSTPAAKQAARTKKRLDTQRAALFPHRYLVVPRHLTKTARPLLWRSTRGLPQLHAWRAIMEQVDAWFDRRCRTSTNWPRCGGASSGSPPSVPR